MKIASRLFVALTILGTMMPMIIGFYTDWLWFGEVQYRQVFHTVVLTRIGIFFAFTVFSAFIIGGAIWVAYRNKPTDLTFAAIDDPMMAYRKQFEKAMRKYMFIFALIVGALVGFYAQSNWRVVQLFFHAENFGAVDPQFGIDYGFYAFTLPMLELIVTILSALLIISGVLALIISYMLGGIRVGIRNSAFKADTDHK